MAAKLSEAMETALYRINDHAWSGANPRTIDALINRGMLVQGPDRVELTDAGREYLGVPSQEVKAEDISHEELKAMLQGEPTFHEKLMSDVAELEVALNTSPWDETPEVDLSAPEFEVERFDSKWTPQQRELAGFTGLERWSNTKVWDGLTALEIRDDLDTEHYVNRAARRTAARTGRKATKVLLGMVS